MDDGVIVVTPSEIFPLVAHNEQWQDVSQSNFLRVEQPIVLSYSLR